MNFNAHSELSRSVRPLAVLMFFRDSEWKRARKQRSMSHFLSVSNGPVDPLIKSPI
jgi:hypothetical protein